MRLPRRSTFQMTEDPSDQKQNPFWIAADERLKSVGVNNVMHVINVTSSSSFPYSMPPSFTPLYSNQYVSHPMPQISNDPYNWYPPPPPPQRVPPPPYAVNCIRPNNHARQNAPRSGGNAVPFNYNSLQNNFRPQGFRMSLTQRTPRPNFQNPLASSNNQNDVLGDPDSGFCIRGKHPASLKEYVKRALAYPNTPEEKYKCETYLYARISPLVSSGACFTVKWDTEPLPHEKKYELTSSWTPSAKLKSPKKERFDPRNQSLSPNHSRKGKYDDFSKSLPAPSRSENGNKKNKNKRKQEMFQLDRELMIQEKRIKFDSPKWGSNFLQDWIKRDRERKPIELNFIHLSQAFKKRSIIPNFFHAKLARSCPKILRSLDQSIVDDFFNRNTERFNPNDYDEVVGTCMDIEKKYFRLTKKPDATEIRPLNVLKRAFDRLKVMARKPENYKYVCDQLRAVRQDLTVQKIRNEFTVAVYEFHARLTLENKDMGEFNQCQSQLRHLYDDIKNCPNEDEFVAYRLLYYIYTRDDQDIVSLLNLTSEKDKKGQCLSFAIQVHDAFLKNHYIRLFKLMNNAPRMCGHVMDLFIDRERRRYFNVIRSSYRPTIKVEVLSKWLNFENQEALCEFAKNASLVPDSTTEPAKWPKL